MFLNIAMCRIDTKLSWLQLMDGFFCAEAQGILQQFSTPLEFEVGEKVAALCNSRFHHWFPSCYFPNHFDPSILPIRVPTNPSTYLQGAYRCGSFRYWVGLVRSFFLVVFQIGDSSARMFSIEQDNCLRFFGLVLFIKKWESTIGISPCIH